MSTWFSATAVVPRLRAEWALSDGSAAWLTIAVQLGFVVGALVSSFLNLTDIFSARRVILVGATGAAVMNLGLVVASGPGTAVPLRAATGMFLAAVYPPPLKLMATWFTKGRGLALGALVGAIAIGSALPHLVNAGGGLEWRVVVAVTSGLTLAGGLIGGLVVPEGPFPFPRARFDPRAVGAVLRDPGVRLASLGYFGHMWELYAMWAWILVFFTASFGAADPAARGPSVAAFVVIVVGAVGCLLGGVLGDRWGRENTTISMMVVSGACALSIGYGSSSSGVRRDGSHPSARHRVHAYRCHHLASAAP
jgi:MFS family permease